MANSIVVDVGHLLAENDEHFISETEFGNLINHYHHSFEKVQESLRTMASPITRSFLSQSSIPDIRHLASSIRDRCDAVLIIGIGGSTLGFRSALQFLRGPYYNLTASTRGLPKVFVVDNIDPIIAAQLEEVLDLSKTAIVYISKSGSTPEPAANFVHFYQKYREAGGIDEDVVIICDPGDNGINHIANKLNCHLLHIPPDLPGRYSVLSSAGILPCELIGVDGSALLAGAADMHNSIVSLPSAKNGLFALSVCLANLAKRDKSIHVLFSYGNILSEFGLWFVQLWAESLGKERSVTGQQVYAGTTPFPALGATDQHSVLQLFREGPNDKIFGFVTIRDMPHQVEIKKSFSDEVEYSYFAGHTMAEQLLTEQIATEVSLVKARRPCYRLVLPDVSAASLGALFYFMEALVVVMAEFCGVNPFDQPGVEMGKKLTYTLMGRRDFSGNRSQCEEELRVFEQKRRLFNL